MSNLIDKDTLVAEIKKIKDEIGIGLNAYEMGEENGKAEMCDMFLSFIDTLEVKEVDLEKELDKFYGMYRDKNGVTHDMQDNEICLDWKEGCNVLFIIEFAKHFFELGLKQNRVNILGIR